MIDFLTGLIIFAALSIIGVIVIAAIFHDGPRT